MRLCGRLPLLTKESLGCPNTNYGILNTSFDFPNHAVFSQMALVASRKNRLQGIWALAISSHSKEQVWTTMKMQE